MNYDGNSAEKALAPYLPHQRAGRAAYADLHEHVAALAQAGLLFVVDRPINKDTEIHPLVRWQYRGGIPEEQRKAFLFTQPDRRRQRAPITARSWSAGLAGNNAIYRIGFGCSSTTSAVPGSAAIAAPIAPRSVTNPACHDSRHNGRRARPRRARPRRACRCRSRRRAGTTHRISQPVTSSPRTQTPACRTSAPIADRSKRAGV